MFLSELLVDRPAEGAQVLATELAEHLRASHGYEVLGPKDGAAAFEQSLAPRALGVATILRLVRRRPSHVVYMPQSGLTPSALIRALVLKAAVKRARFTVVFTQIHLGSAARRAWHLLRFLGAETLVATAEQQKNLRSHGVRAQLLAARIPTRKVSSRSHEDAQSLHDLTGAGPIYLHVGHASAGRNLHVLGKLSPPGLAVIVLSSTFAEEPGVVPVGENVVVKRGHIDDLGALYRAADVYVFPTVSARSVIGIPMSIVEALANGTPVVAVESEVTVRFKNMDGVYLAPTLEDLPSLARRIAGTAGRVAEGSSFATTAQCAHDLEICMERSDGL